MTSLEKRQQFGRDSEKLAQRFLKKQGHKIIETNFRSHWGEIDIISLHCDVLVFTEVRSKSNTRYGTPEDTVDRKKQEKIRKTATYYLHSKHIHDRFCRFDVITVVCEDHCQPRLTHFEDAF